MKILFLASDPKDTSRLRLGQELRDIRERLRLAKQRDDFILESRESVRLSDITQAIFDAEPQVIHFSGHGTSSGELCFEDTLGRTRTVSSDTLSNLFELFSNSVDCVILNACYSSTQAEAIANHIPFVIGMNNSIKDKTSIAFSVGFYKALGAGRSFKDAYKFGCVEIQFERQSSEDISLKGSETLDSLIPVLYTGKPARKKIKKSINSSNDLLLKSTQQVYTAATLAKNTINNISIFSDFKFTADVMSMLVSYRESGKYQPADYSDTHLAMLIAKLSEAYQNTIYNEPDVYSVRRKTLDQALETDFFSKETEFIKSTVRLEFFSSNFQLYRGHNLFEQSRLLSKKPDLKDFCISCSSIFPLILATLLSMQKSQRYDANFDLIEPKLYGTYQIRFDLDKDNNQIPNLIFTANSPFYFLASEYRKAESYKLLKEISYVPTKRATRSPSKELISKKPIAFLEKTIAEQHYLKLRHGFEALLCKDFTRFFNYIDDVDNIVAWEPLATGLASQGWRVVGEEFYTPISLFVRDDLLEYDLERLKWFLHVFFSEYDFCCQNEKYTLEILLKNNVFTKSFKRICFTGNQ